MISDFLGVLQMLVKQPLAATSSSQILIQTKIDFWQKNGWPIALSTMEPAITPKRSLIGHQHAYSM